MQITDRTQITLGQTNNPTQFQMQQIFTQRKASIKRQFDRYPKEGYYLLSFYQQSYYKNLLFVMGVKQDKNNKNQQKNKIPPEQESDQESNQTMPILALGNLSLEQRDVTNETVAPHLDLLKNKLIKKKTVRSQAQSKEKMKQKINTLSKRIKQLQEELSIAKKQEDSCPHCHFYLNQPRISTRDRNTTPQDSSMMDCFKRSTSRDSLQFQKIDFAAPLMYNSQMEEKSWIFLGTILIAMGSKVLDIDGTVNVFKIVKESVDKIRRQVQKSQQKLSMDFFMSKQELQGQSRMQELSFDPFYHKQENHTGLQLQGVRVESVQQYDLYFDQKLTFNVKYDALITIMQYMKENSNISFT